MSFTLRYANFHFEPNAAGKMMLGIWFVFSKQYSDKLSEDVTAGNAKCTHRGEAVGQQKHGYTRGEDGRWVPDEVNFDIVREAFRMKIYDRRSNEDIAEYMNKSGYSYIWGKEKKKEK